MAAITSIAGFLTIFQMNFCQSVPMSLGCILPPDRQNLTAGPSKGFPFLVKICYQARIGGI